MPFRSVKQRNFLKWKHPDIYQRWKGEHGTRIAKSEALLRQRAQQTRENATWRKQHPDWSARMDKWSEMSDEERKQAWRGRRKKIAPQDIKFVKPKRERGKRRLGIEIHKAGMMPPKLKPPTIPAMRPTPMKPALSRPPSMAMPARRAAATRQTPGVKPQMPVQQAAPRPVLKPTGMTGRPMPNAKPAGPAPIAQAPKPPKQFGKADWRVGPATVDEDDKRYAYAGAGTVGAGGGAFAARKQNAKPLPWTESRRAAADKLMAVEPGKTVRMDLATLRQFRRNPGVRINDYGHTVSLAGAMKQGTKLPPVTVRIVEGKQPFIMDGMHRINAAHMLGMDSVPIRIEHETRAPRFRFPRIYNRKSLKMQQRVPRQLTDAELKQFAFKKPKTPFGAWAMARNAKKGGKPWNLAVPKVRFH